MNCYTPLRAWYGAVNPKSGKRPLVFNHAEAVGERLEIPCGKCPGCRGVQSMMWSLRIYNEASLHDQNSFITLTYDEANCPRELNKKHLQDFFKRLRHHGKFRYFACGEYGGKTRRPHYHAIIFGQDFLANSSPFNSDTYLSPLLTDTWGQGQTLVAPVSMASCCYVAGYTNKKNADPDTFTLMSRGRGEVKGIGHHWLDQFGDDLRRTGTVAIEGREYAIPKRYLDWADVDTPGLFDVVKQERKKYVRLTKIKSAAQAAEYVRKSKAQLVNQLARMSSRDETI